jgi:hypothetical protein
MPTSPRLHPSARLSREAQIELLNSARLSSPRKAASAWARSPPDPPPRLSLPLISPFSLRTLLFLPSAPAPPTTDNHRRRGRPAPVGRRRACRPPRSARTRPPCSCMTPPRRAAAGSRRAVGRGHRAAGRGRRAAGRGRRAAGRGRRACRPPHRRLQIAGGAPPQAAPHRRRRPTSRLAGAPRPAIAGALRPVIAGAPRPVIAGDLVQQPNEDPIAFFDFM